MDPKDPTLSLRADFAMHFYRKMCYILLLNLLWISDAFASNIRDNNFARNELRLGEVSVRLPAVNPSQLNADVRNALYTAKKFASKYDQKLEDVHRRILLDKRQHPKGNLAKGESVLLHDVENLRHDFLKDYKVVKNKMGSVKSPTVMLRGSIMDASLMSRLNEFMQLLGKLPAKITCLIFDCGIEVNDSTTDVTTSAGEIAQTESFEVIEE